LFVREPVSFGVTVAGLAVAIGVTTSIFNLLNVAALRGYGVRSPSSLVQLRPFVAERAAEPWTYDGYERLRQSLPPSTITALAWAGSGSLSFGNPAGSEPLEYVTLESVSGNYFSVLGGTVSQGRTLSESDDEAGAPRVVMMSDIFWKTRYGSDPAIVGKAVRLGGESFTIVGVAARGFMTPDEAQPPALWVPLTAFVEMLERQPKSTFVRARMHVNVFGRIGREMSAVRLASVASSVAADLAAQRGVSDPARRPSARLISMSELQFDGGTQLIITMVMTVVGLILVLGCANVVNILLASAAGRRREIGTRLALGADRERIGRQLLTESLLLAVVGGAAGLAIAAWMSPWIASRVPARPMVDFSPDPIVYVFGTLAALVSGVVAGLAPARYGRRGDLMSALNADVLAAGSALPANRLRSLLVGVQAAASIVLLVMTALFARGFAHAASSELGLNADGLLNVHAYLGREYNAASAMAFKRIALERLREMPGVTGAALANIAPFEGGYAPQPLPSARPQGIGAYLRGESRRDVYRNETSAEYFAAVGMRVVRGRPYTSDEVRTEAPVAVISDSLARAYWGSDDPVGSSLQRVWGDDDPTGAPSQGLLRKPSGTRIVGVVSDAITRLANYEAPTIYLPIAATSSPGARIVVSVDGDPGAMVRPVHEAIRALDPNTRPRVTRVRDLHAGELENPKALAAIAAVVGSSALALAVVGLFGVTVFVVSQRQHEVSVRMALGASAREILALVLRDSLRPVAIGLSCGLVLALAAGHVIRGALYGVSGHDPVSIVSAILTLLVAATGAALGPARRALRIDPAEMLKQS
jgi:putative ABC transport system permease protein